VKPIKTDREDDRLLYRADRHLRKVTTGVVQDAADYDLRDLLKLVQHLHSSVQRLEKNDRISATAKCSKVNPLKVNSMYATEITNRSYDARRAVLWIRNYFFSDPDPALGLISDPDPACLTKVIRLYLICPQESIAQRFSSHFRRCHCIFVTEKKNCRNSTYRYVLCFLSQKYTSTVMYNETSQLTPGYKYIVKSRFGIGKILLGARKSRFRGGRAALAMLHRYR